MKRLAFYKWRMKEADSAGWGEAQGWSPGTKTVLKTELDVGLRWL